MDDLSRDAIDTVMRVAHNLRKHHADHRALTMPECTILTCDERLRRAGWIWGPDGPMAPVAGVAPSQAPSGDCVAITGLEGRTVAYAVYTGSESSTASVQFFFNDGTGFVVAASGKNVLNFRPVEQIPGALAHDARGDAPTVFDELIAFEETCEVKPTFADAVRIALAAKKRTSGVQGTPEPKQKGPSE